MTLDILLYSPGKEKRIHTETSEKKQKGFMEDFQDSFPELKKLDISNILRELKVEGKIIHEGSRKTGYWRSL